MALLVTFVLFVNIIYKDEHLLSIENMCKMMEDRKQKYAYNVYILFYFAPILKIDVYQK